MTQFDSFPNIIDAGSSHYDLARVFAVNGRAGVIVMRDSRPVLVEDAVFKDMHRAVNQRHWIFVVERDGAEEEWAVRRGGGCGCGHFLRKLQLREFLREWDNEKAGV